MDQQLNGSPGEDTSKPITAFARVEGGSGGWKAVGVSVPASFNKMYGPKTKNMGLALKKNIGTQSLILISVPEAKPLKKAHTTPPTTRPLLWSIHGTHVCVCVCMCVCRKCRCLCTSSSPRATSM
mmetsp:Transcript_30477/g.75671  ORF Transcript_30477/g.75671 Transcript_30477/m.75671 type:complete len:125 (-) Transcript_30477:64-438(-)